MAVHRWERPCSQMILATVSRRTDSHPTTAHSNHLKNRRKMPDRIRYKKQNVIPSRVFEKRSAVSFAASKSASLALRNVLRLARVRNRCRSARPISTRSKNLAIKIEIIYLFYFAPFAFDSELGMASATFLKSEIGDKSRKAKIRTSSKRICDIWWSFVEDSGRVSSSMMSHHYVIPDKSCIIIQNC